VRSALETKIEKRKTKSENPPPKLSTDN